MAVEFDIEEIAKRPYHTIVGPNGEYVSVPPNPAGGGGPLTVGQRHPDDYYGAVENEKGEWVATQNCYDLPSA